MQSRPIVAEIVGPSGAGKSTLSAALNSGSNNIKAGITVWGLPIVSLIFSGFQSLPDLVKLSLCRKQIKKEELKQVIRLTAFYRLLNRHIYSGKKHGWHVLFMDEGIIFALAKLRADIGPEFDKYPLEQWEQKMLDRWSQILDAVIWLDAPDAVLVDRIRNRAKHHRMKSEPVHRINDFLKDYREAYEFVISELTRRSNVRVLTFASEHHVPATLAEETMKFVGIPLMPEKTGRVLTAARGIENEQTA